MCFIKFCERGVNTFQQMCSCPVIWCVTSMNTLHFIFVWPTLTDFVRVYVPETKTLCSPLSLLYQYTTHISGNSLALVGVAWHFLTTPIHLSDTQTSVLESPRCHSTLIHQNSPPEFYIQEDQPLMMKETQHGTGHV